MQTAESAREIPGAERQRERVSKEDLLSSWLGRSVFDLKSQLTERQALLKSLFLERNPELLESADRCFLGYLAREKGESAYDAIISFEKFMSCESRIYGLAQIFERTEFEIFNARNSFPNTRQGYFSGDRREGCPSRGQHEIPGQGGYRFF
jgi:hypothetical protein